MPKDAQRDPLEVALVDRDGDLLKAASASLHDSGYAALAFVGCEASGDRIILHGSVPSYHLKQLAQSIVARAVGGRRVENRLAVRRSVDAMRAHR
jgi:hypothetical protein